MASRISGGLGGVLIMLGRCAEPECCVRIRFKHSNTKAPTKPPPTCRYAKAPATFIKSSRPCPRASRSTSSAKRVSGLKSSPNMAASPAISTNSSPAPQPRPTAAPQLNPHPTSVAGPYRTLREQDLRETPSTNARVVTRLPADIKVNVIRSEGDWLRVESQQGGKPGYLDKRDVERWKDR